MNGGKVGEGAENQSKGGDGGSGAAGGPVGGNGTGNPTSAGGGGGGDSYNTGIGGNGGMKIGESSSPAKGGSAGGGFGGVSGGGGGGGIGGGGGGGGKGIGGVGGAAAFEGGGQKGDDGDFLRGGKGGDAGPNSGGGGGGGGAAAVAVGADGAAAGGKGGSGYVKYTWISKFLEITLTQKCYSQTSTSIPIATVYNPTNLPLTVSIDWTPPFNSSPTIENNIIYSTIPSNGTGKITVTYTKDDVSYSETLEIKVSQNDIIFPCLISQHSTYNMLAVIQSCSEITNICVSLKNKYIPFVVQKTDNKYLIFITSPKKKGCYQGRITTNTLSKDFILNVY